MLPMEDYEFLHTKHINFSLLNFLLNKEHKFSIPPPSCVDFPIFKNYKSHNITFKQDILNYDKNIKSQDRATGSRFRQLSWAWSYCLLT